MARAIAGKLLGNARMDDAGQIIVHEVGPAGRPADGKQVVPIEQKIDWIDGLIAAGVDVIQVGSFVHPEKVPQMADTDELFAESASRAQPAGVVLSGLVLNEKGLERGLACGVEIFCMGVSASETHSQKNTGMAIAEATDRIIAIAKRGGRGRQAVQVSVQSAFGCGFEGTVAEGERPRDRQALPRGGAHEHQPRRHRGPRLPRPGGGATSRRSSPSPPTSRLACHIHDTYGMGMANVCAAMKAGVETIETGFAGLGGCPFTKVAGGNVATEDLVHMLQRMGLRTDIDLGTLDRGRAATSPRFFGREMPGTVYRTGGIAAGAATGAN